MKEMHVLRQPPLILTVVLLHVRASLLMLREMTQKKLTTLNMTFSSKNIKITKNSLKHLKVKTLNILITSLLWYNVDPTTEATLRYVRIYFETPTFDKIEKDRAAKFVDMLSAIGGTMGLLTGFSIISGVEIVYFLIKIILKIIRKNNKSKNLKSV